MKDKEDLTIGDRFIHSSRGVCIFTETAYALECMNPDLTSLFLLVDGESEEVELSIDCLTKIEENIPELCVNCFRELKEGEISICSSCVRRIASKLGDSQNGIR
jgi:hypothetical protein